MKCSKKGKFEFIDFKTGNEVPRNKYVVNRDDHQQINSQSGVKPASCPGNHLDPVANHQPQHHPQHYPQHHSQHHSQHHQQSPIRISPFNIKQNMPFCYANYSMMNSHPRWMNSDEENSLKNKISDSMASQIITVDCSGSTTTTQIASSTASSCSLPANDDSDKLCPANDYESFKPSSPIKSTNKSGKSTTNLINSMNNLQSDLHPINQPSYQQAYDKKQTSGQLAPLTLEWTNLSCEISTKKSFIANAFNCFITNERAHIYNNSESSSLNDLNNRESEASSYQLEQMFRKKKKGKKLILDKQSGQFKSGTINAIIGASGAGKSTLLECISGRRVHGVEGTVNVYANTEIFGKNVTLAYLGQVETITNVLTVKEVLLFASRLKNYRKIKTFEQHQKLVNSIISEFKLECCANNHVHSISGGQLKRVAIAAELISGPDILLLDEPTSGLDSCTAYTCIKLLRKITGLVDHQHQYRAPIVICSIHQPSIQLLNEFHNLYVLSNNGRCIYQGKPQSMVKYLSRFNLECPKYHDPVNFITELASGYYGFEVIHHLAEQERMLQEQRTIELQDNLFIKTNICGNPFKNCNYANAIYEDLAGVGGAPMGDKLEQYVESKLNCNLKSSKKLFKQMSQSHHHQLPFIRTTKISNVVHQMRTQSFPFLYHTLLLINRTFLGTIREPKLTWLRVFQALFIGFLMSFLYDHPIGRDGSCWSEANAIKELLSSSNAQLAKSIRINEDSVRMMMNLTNLNGDLLANSSELRRLAKRSTVEEPNSRLDEFLNQNKINHQLNSKANTGDNIAFVFFVTLFLVMSSMMPTVLTFPTEVRILQEELKNGYYGCSSYYLAKVIADTPFIIFNAILFCSIVYPLTGQLLEPKIFYLFTFVAIVAALIAHCIGMLFGTIYVHSVASATFMAPLSMSPVFLFSGFFAKISSLPMFLKPVAYMSYVRYCFECFLISLYGFDRCKIAHNKTFFLHRYIHNWELFQKERDLFFGFKSNLTTTTSAPPVLPSNAQALIQNHPFNSSSLGLPNDLFKNFSSFATDRNLLSRFQSSFFKHNNTIRLPDLMTVGTTEANRPLMNGNPHLNVDLSNLANFGNFSNLANLPGNVSSVLSDLITESSAATGSTASSLPSSIASSVSSALSDGLSTLAGSISSTTATVLVDDASSIANLTNLTNLIDPNTSSISASTVATNAVELLNESEISRRTFSNMPASLVLEFYGIDDETFWNNIIILTAIFLFLRVLAYIILVVKTNKFK